MVCAGKFVQSLYNRHGTLMPQWHVPLVYGLYGAGRLRRTTTEPNYVKWLARGRQNAAALSSKTFVVAMDPRPKEDNPGSPAINPHRSARKNRELQQRDTIIEGEIEEAYIAYPVRFRANSAIGAIRWHLRRSLCRF